MKVVGLTGGIGMGKSAAEQLLRERRIPVIDTDSLARQIVEPGQPALAEIAQVFGKEFIGPDARLRRGDLARRIFPDPVARKALEDILHPRIRALWREQVEVWDSEGHPLAFVVIPLLFETRAEAELNATVCVACSSATQRQRLLARGWSPEQMQQRILAQWPIEKKIGASTFLIWSEGSLDIHAAQLDRILATLRSRQMSAPKGAS